MKRKIVKCPYCGAHAALRPATVVHGESGNGDYLWVCSRYPACDSYVSAHKGSKEPLGTLANKTLRRKRREAHLVFNRLWENGIMRKGSAYRWLQAKFALNENQAHIALFSERMCDELIELCKQALHNNGMAA